MTEKTEQKIVDARLQFLLSIDRLLKASEEAKRTRDLLFEIVNSSNLKDGAIE